MFHQKVTSKAKLVLSMATQSWFEPTDFKTVEMKHVMIRISADIKIDWTLFSVPALSAKDKYVKPFRKAESLA
jgi:dTDP-4-dehydrorhamnose 3,5-epimerase-like enzyme